MIPAMPKEVARTIRRKTFITALNGTRENFILNHRVLVDILHIQSCAGYTHNHTSCIIMAVHHEISRVTGMGSSSNPWNKYPRVVEYGIELLKDISRTEGIYWKCGNCSQELCVYPEISEVPGRWLDNKWGSDVCSNCISVPGYRISEFYEALILLCCSFVTLKHRRNLLVGVD